MQSLESYIDKVKCQIRAQIGISKDHIGLQGGGEGQKLLDDFLCSTRHPYQYTPHLIIVLLHSYIGVGRDKHSQLEIL